MLKVLSLFSGICAFEKALERQGIEYQLVNYCEIDKYASKAYSLIHNVSEQMNLGDITKIDTFELDDDIDIITHGSPCQDFSVAGNQAGGDKGSNTRSSLMWNTVDIVKHVRPKIVLWENVKNILGKKHRHNFDSYIQIMDELGYNSYYQVLNAKDYGIPQNRERVYTISIRNDIDSGDFKLPEPFELKLRLKDMLEDKVDEKFYLSQDKVERFIKNNNGKLNMNKSVLDTCHEKNDLSFATRDRVYNLEIDSPNLTATMYKDDPKVIQIGNCMPITNRANPNPGRVYDENGISPTLTTMQGGLRQPCILVKENNKAGYKVAHEGDDINIISRMKWQRGNVQKQSCKTITTSGGNDRGVVTTDYRIRKLTPRECFRLMGFDDSDFDKVEGNLSNTQLYKQAGNSIVVNVLEEIYKHLFKSINL